MDVRRRQAQLPNCTMVAASVPNTTTTLFLLAPAPAPSPRFHYERRNAKEARAPRFEKADKQVHPVYVLKDHLLALAIRYQPSLPWLPKRRTNACGTRALNMPKSE